MSRSGSSDRKGKSKGKNRYGDKEKSRGSDRSQERKLYGSGSQADFERKDEDEEERDVRSSNCRFKENSKASSIEEKTSQRMRKIA